MLKVILPFLFLISIVFSSPGRLIVIDGLSSSGKTTIISNLMPLLIKENYETVALDDFVTKVFLARERQNMSQEQFLLSLSLEKKKMYEEIREKIFSGKNLLFDTILCGVNGEKDLKEALAQFKDLPVTFILAYCPFHELISRIKERNVIAQKENNRGNYRPPYLLFKLKDMFHKRKDGEAIIGRVYYKDVELACKAALDVSLESEKVAELKSSIIDNFQLKPGSYVDISSKIEYDFFIDTSLNDPKECAEKIHKFLSNVQSEAFSRNLEKFASK